MNAGEAISISGSELVIQALVAPRSSRNAFIGFHDGRLKIALAAPPVDGEANAALVAFLSGALKVPKSSISIARGAQSKRKDVRITSADPAGLRTTLLESLRDCPKK